jgi:hypothetical protein
MFNIFKHKNPFTPEVRRKDYSQVLTLLRAYQKYYNEYGVMHEDSQNAYLCSMLVKRLYSDEYPKPLIEYFTKCKKLHPLDLFECYPELERIKPEFTNEENPFQISPNHLSRAWFGKGESYENLLIRISMITKMIYLIDNPKQPC